MCSQEGTSQGGRPMLWTRTQGGEGEMGGTAVAQPGARCLMWASRYPLPTAGRCENAVSIPASPSPSLAFTGSLNLSADSAQQRLNVSFPTASPPCSYHTPLLCPPVRSPSSLNDRSTRHALSSFPCTPQRPPIWHPRPPSFSTRLQPCHRCDCVLPCLPLPDFRATFHDEIQL